MMNKQSKYIDDKSLREKEGGFRLPENYFEDFESKMIMEIEERPIQRKGKMINIKFVLAAFVPIAAVLILGYFLFIDNSSQVDSGIISDELGWDEYASFDENWIVNELSEFEEEREVDLELDIDFLIDEGVTTNEIIEVYQEIP